MNTISVSEARANIFRLMDEVAQTHQPITITGKRSNAVLISQEDWQAIQETIYLSSIPKMAESIVEGMKTPLDECVESGQLKW
ncbi:MAG: type II toxin-antitoxin system Phd/YefM family antitoxin [Rickettsiales bacterium]